jgi:L-ascorbate metabolism protein UlaG (beta-lactamase superfamily)
MSDVAEIAARTGATVYANFEIATWFEKNHGVKNAVGMNIGGQAKTSFGSVKMTNAIHSSQLPDGSYGGNPGGFLLTMDGTRFYFACDTALFSDMQLIGIAGIDVAVVPIGDLFTMGPEDSLQAIRWVNPKYVLPTHFNTWPPIEQDAYKWAERVKSETKAVPITLEPGQTHRF